MGTTAISSESFDIGMKRSAGRSRGEIGATDVARTNDGSHGQMGGFVPWFRLFLGISGAALVIALALGLIVLLTTTTAHAQTVLVELPASEHEAGITVREVLQVRHHSEERPVEHY